MVAFVEGGILPLIIQFLPEIASYMYISLSFYKVYIHMIHKNLVCETADLCEI